MLIVIIIIAAILLIVFLTYNSLITAKNRVAEALSEIDVQLKRRTDLIPNLVETVKGYAKHEKSVFENVTKARASLLGAKTMSDKAQANNQLAQTLKSLFAVAEAYPDLKASDNFKELQEELSDTENKIAYSRQFYNTVVLDYNNKLKVFPTVVFANMLHFTPADFFAATEEEKKEVSVKF
ncbi:MAG TPA: LemA family protein [Candidatus Saccharimonadales bacterium]|nr:LemA family protein [Candidatus Saccharimonadales bacterium]